jgi:hypothetical protein
MSTAYLVSQPFGPITWFAVVLNSGLAIWATRRRNIKSVLLLISPICVSIGLVLPALNARGGLGAIDGDLLSTASVLLAFAVGFASSAIRSGSRRRSALAILELSIACGAVLFFGWTLWLGTN